MDEVLLIKTINIKNELLDFIYLFLLGRVV